MSKAKLTDVAAMAGVSKSTVSQYLNGRFEYMSKATQARVKEAISELDYVPNPIARNLKASKTKTIGVIVRDITGYYSSKAIRGIDDYCKANNYHALIYNTDFDSTLEARALESLYQLRVDGIIIASSGKNTQQISRYIAKGLPIVQFQLDHDDSEKNIIMSDYKKAAFEATEYLIELGHKRICFASQDFADVKSRNERFEGYTQAMAKHKINIEPGFVQHWNREEGFTNDVMDVINEVKPTAIFTQHLAITTELLNILNHNNVDIPQDISLLGFDEIPMVEFFKVPITVVRQRPYEIGHLSAKCVLNLIDHPDTPPQRTVVSCSIDKRESCRAINR